MPVECGITDTLQVDLKSTREMGPEMLLKHLASRDATIGTLNDTMGAIKRGESIAPGTLQHDAMLAAAVADKVRSIESRFGSKKAPGEVAGGDTPIRLKDVAEFGDKLAEAMPEAKLYARLKTLEPYQRDQWLANMWRGRKQAGNIGDLYMTLYLNAKLSSPWTLAKTTLGDTSMLPVTISDRLFAGMWGAMAKTGADRYLPGEAAVGAMSFWGTALDQLKMIARRDWDGIHTQMVTEGEYRPPIHMPDNAAGNLFNAIAGAPSYVLGAQRAGYAQIQRSAALDMASYREAWRRASAEGLTYDQAMELRTHLKQNPTPEMLTEAMDHTAYHTMNRNLEGFLGKVQDVTTPAFMKVLVNPFPRIGLNMIDIAVDHFPGIAHIKKANQADFAAGGRRQQMMLAKQTTGALVLGTGLTLSLSGLISGEGPIDEASNATWQKAGHRKNHVYNPFTGEPMFSHEFLGPFSGLLASFADLGFILQHTDEMTGAQIAASVAIALAEPFSRTGYLESWGDITGVLRDGTGEGAMRAVRDRIESMGIVLKPAVAGFVRDLENSDRKAPSRGGRGGFLEKQWEMMKDEVAGAWPGWAAGQPVHRNYITDEATPRDGAAPWYRAVTGDEVAKEMFRLGSNNGGSKFQVFAPPKSIGEVPLTAWESDRLIQHLTNEPFGPDGKLYDAMKKMMASKDYQKDKDGPAGGKAKRLDMLYTSYLNAAQRKLMQEDKHLAWLVAEKQIEAGNKLTPEGAAPLKNPLGAEPQEVEYPRPGQKER